MRPATLERIRDGTTAKGDVLGIARVAAIQAAKRTSELIPLCHPLALTRVAVSFDPDVAASAIRIEVTAETLRSDRRRNGGAHRGQCRPPHHLRHVQGVDRGMRIEAIRVLEKSGGKSGQFTAE
jgi:cyclic pyranopterin phosphate synthase